MREEKIEIASLGQHDGLDAAKRVGYLSYGTVRQKNNSF